MKEIGFNIINWAAFAPGLNEKQDWQKWASDKKTIDADLSLTPSVDFLPPMYRRRLSQLTKMSLKVANECIAGNQAYQNIESVFASRYGELGQTLKLLRSIFDKEELSPAGFSLSVHNTAAGLHSINNQNIAPYTAIAASELTFEAALIESISRLQNNKYVLLVIGEEYIPKLSSIEPYAIALLLGQDHKIKMTPSTKSNVSSGNMALNFLKWFLKNEDIFCTNLYQIKRQIKDDV